MKNTILTVAILIVMVLNFQSYGQAYQFPIKPGDERWKKFQTGEERYNACQIPSDILKSLTTKDLVTTCLNYPMIGSMFAFDNLQTGFEELTKRFNGFEELLKRRDAGRELIKVYSKMSPSSFDKAWTLERTGLFTFEFSYIETMLAQTAIQSGLSVNDKTELLKLCVQQYEAKGNHIDIFAIHGIGSTAWVTGRILQSQKSIDLTSNGTSLFISKGILTDTKVAYEIMEKARTFIK